MQLTPSALSRCVFQMLQWALSRLMRSRWACCGASSTKHIHHSLAPYHSLLSVGISMLPLTSRRTLLFATLVLLLPLGTWWYFVTHSTREPQSTSPRIAFESDRDIGFQIYTINPDGTDERRLTYHRHQWGLWGRLIFNEYAQMVINIEPKQSPHGSGIMYMSTWEGEYAWYVMNIDGSNSRRLPFPISDNPNTFVSPNGQYIAFFKKGGFLRLMKSDGSDERCLTCSTPGTLSSIAWSNDSNQLVFSLKSGETSRLYLIARSSNILTPITASPTTAHLAAARYSSTSDSPADRPTRRRLAWDF